MSDDEKWIERLVIECDGRHPYGHPLMSSVSFKAYLCMPGVCDRVAAGLSPVPEWWARGVVLVDTAPRVPFVFETRWGIG